jgi:predicted nucleic acid-binding protein
MIVVADTGPINYLIWIGHVAVLPRLYTTVLIPEAVQDELRKPGAPEFVRRWIETAPEWIEIRKPMRAPALELMRVRIGPGKRDAILLAEESGADALIVDDQRGRKEAGRRKLHTVGTLGVLQFASKKGLLDLEELIDRLISEKRP